MGLTPRDIVLPEIPCDGDLDMVMYRHDGTVFEPVIDGRDLNKDFWQHRQADRVQEWEQTVRAYEANPDDVYYAWRYLDSHPVFWKFDRLADGSMPLAERIHERHLTHEYGIHRCVDIEVQKIDPASRSTEADWSARTETEIWIELGQYSWPQEPSTDPNRQDCTYHDYRLDCGGPTLDAAIIKAAYNVHEAYGNDRRVCDAPFDEATYAFLKEEEAADGQ